MEEKRLNERFREALEVTYSFLVERDSTPVLFKDTQTLDISREGVRLLVHDEVHKDTLIQMSIRVPSIKNPVLMLGKVRWTDQRENGMTEVGIRFLGNLPRGLEDIVARISRLREKIESKDPQT